MHSSLILVLALAAGVFAQCFARQLRIPGIVLLLALGVLLGPDFLDVIDPDDLGEGLFGLVDIAVAVILFEGGLNLEMARLKRQESAIRGLITIGALVTFIGATVAVLGILDWDFRLSFLFGSLVVVTGPTVVTPLLRDMRLRPRVKTILEAEGVLIDPIGAILAVLVLQVVLGTGGDDAGEVLRQVVERLGYGIGAGMLGGFAMVGMLRSRLFIPRGFENIATLAMVLLLFEGCEQIVGHSGIVAVTMAGVVVGNMKTHVERDLREFKDQLTILLVGLLFILLAADVRLENVTALGWRGLGVVAALVLAVRPVGVWLSTRRSGLNSREQVFISWVAPRGIVAAAIASLTVAAMATAQPPMAGGDQLQALVFLTIAGTVVLAGFTARPLATLLRLRLPNRDRVAILGAQGLGLALAEELRGEGIGVVFLEADPNRCREAEEAGFNVVMGDGLEERAMIRAQMELVGTAIGLTPNEHLNSLFVSQARDLFDVPRGIVAVEALDVDAPEHVKRQEGTSVFSDGPHDVARWDVRARHGEVEIKHVVYEPEEADDVLDDDLDEAPLRIASVQERYVMLAVERSDKLAPMTHDFEPKRGDIATVALYALEREEALAALAEQSWVEWLPLDPDDKGEDVHVLDEEEIGVEIELDDSSGQLEA